MSKTPTESEIQTAVIKYLALCENVRIWRQNTGAAKFNNRVVRFGVPGAADLSGIIFPSGKRLEIELKTAAGRQSKAQIAYAAMIRKHGGVYILARCVEDIYTDLCREFPFAAWPTPAELTK